LSSFFFTETYIHINSSERHNTQQTFNNWAMNASHDLLSDIPLQPTSKLAIANIVYLSASWLNSFDDKLTETLSFNTDRKTVNVPFMAAVEELHYAEDTYYLKCKVLSKAFETSASIEASRIMMHIVVPDGSIDELLQKITALNFGQMVDNGNVQSVQYKIPRVSLSSSNLNANFKDFLQSYYETEFFTKDKLSFAVRGFNSDKVESTVDEIIQETLFRVDEHGLETQQYNRSPSSASLPTKYLIANKPFLMIVREESTKMILFWATVRDPSLA